MKGDLDLGPFSLTHPIGVGGMGEVWGGRHRDGGEDVAVKLVPAELAQTRALREALRNEVRAMARLSHPGIVPVLAYGAVAPDEARRSSGRLAEGSPYFAMRLISGGTLKERPRVANYEVLAHLLTGILEALAHAHARGVVHRDIKPSNVLLAPRSDGPPLPILTDFGIASALLHDDDPADGPTPGGTPWYMAPEQILGRTREEGPWTDLYSVGCLAFKLATGRPPYRGTDRGEVCRAQVTQPIPRISAPFPIPEGFGDLIDALLAKRPDSRMRTAADALHALRRLRGAPQISVDEGDAYALLEDLGSEPTTLEATPLGALAPPAPLPRGMDFERPDFVGSWHKLNVEERPSAIGLGLFGLRPVPLAGRSAERDLLWAELAQVFKGDGPRVALLTGATGLGKSHVARWLAERADELGVARPLHATFTRTPGAVAGLTGMLAGHLRTRGLEGDELRDQLQMALGHTDDDDLGRDIEDLARLLSPTAHTAHEAPEERWAVIARAVSRLARERPVIATLDDAHYAGEALDFVAHALRTQSATALRALFVITVDDEKLAGREAERSSVDALRAHEATRVMALSPLDEAEQEELVLRHLGVAADLGRKIVTRTAGQPLFAVQLVSDLVQRGLLEATAQGLAPRGDASATLAADLTDVWSERIVLLLAEVADAETAELCLEIAATLGAGVDGDEWSMACRLSNLDVPEGLRDALEAAGLVSPTEVGFSFAHDMLRDRLLARAVEAGRSTAHHEACAAMIGALYPDADGRTSERRGRHMLSAGAFAEAQAPLLDAIDARIGRAELPAARELLELRQRALAAMKAPPTDREAIENEVRAAEVEAVRGNIEETEAILARTEPFAQRSGHRDLVGRILWLRGGVSQKRADLDAAIGSFGRAERALRDSGEELLAARCQHGIAECEKLRGDLDAAGRRYEAAGTYFAELGDPLYHGRSEIGLADIRRRQGDLDAAEEIARAGLAHVREAQNRHAVATALNGLGDIARLRSRLSYAEAYYREALRLFDELGSDDRVIVRLNLALTLLDRSAFAEATRVLEHAEREVLDTGRGFYRVFVHAALLPCEAAAGNAAGWNRRESELRDTLAQSGLVDDDLGRCLLHAAREARKAGWPERARSAYSLAAEQWRKLGRAAAAEDAERQAQE